MRIYKIASHHKIETWDEIRQREDPAGINHDLKLVCIRCRNEMTCRCTKPKRRFEGLCDDCVKKKGHDVITGIGS